MADKKLGPDVGNAVYDKFRANAPAGLVLKFSDDGIHLYAWPQNGPSFMDSVGNEQPLWGLGNSHYHLTFAAKGDGKYYLKRIQLTVRICSFDYDDDPDNKGFHRDMGKDDFDADIVKGKVNKCIAWWGTGNGKAINNNVNRVFEEMKKGKALQAYINQWGSGAFLGTVNQMIVQLTGNANEWNVVYVNP